MSTKNQSTIDKFSLGTISGLTLGILLAGYAVFAYTPPTQAPPEGNTEAPLNTGLEDQIKQGGLWLENGLIIDGGLRIGQQATCDTDTKGALAFNTTEKKSYICDGNGWNEYKGAQGDAGSSGSTGSQGPTGPTGPTGPAGL